MGLFDRFKSAPKTAEAKPRRPEGSARAASKWADRIEKRAQNYDRAEAIQALSDMENAEAVTVLLKRFTFHIDPSITDQEEKDAAFRGILRAGREAIEPVRAFAAKAETLAWPMKIVKAIVDDDEYVEELLQWLSKWDTEYSKFVEPKVQLLSALEDHKHVRIREEIEKFLEDVNEPARFHAASTLLVQDDAAVVPALVKLLLEEESVRVKTRVSEGLVARAWPVPEADRAGVRKVLPPAYMVDGAGRVTKR
jgi:HEAT repeat protein